MYISVVTRKEQKHRLISKLFEHYHPEFLPRLNDSQPVKVQFAFELINIKEVVSMTVFFGNRPTTELPDTVMIRRSER